MDNEYIYWVGIAHLSFWKQERINSLVVDILNKKQMSLCDFFGLSKKQLVEMFSLTEKEIGDIEGVKIKLPNISFQVEDLLRKDIKIIPLNSALYPKTMKENLKMKYSPAIIYTKGDTKILGEDSVAIVGSRNASDNALEFTDNIAKKMAEEYRVVVSGYAKGVDRQALDSSIKYNGNSIIVLPQGILTFDSGFKKYQNEIENAGVIVLSTFPPDAGWSVGLAMERNRYIYGLAKEIYVAQTNSTGGTWNGAIEGLKKGRDVFVYYSGDSEENANYELIKKGAKPVDFDGNPILLKQEKTKPHVTQLTINY